MSPDECLQSDNCYSLFRHRGRCQPIAKHLLVCELKVLLPEGPRCATARRGSSSGFRLVPPPGRTGAALPGARKELAVKPPAREGRARVRPAVSARPRAGGHGGASRRPARGEGVRSVSRASALPPSALLSAEKHGGSGEGRWAGPRDKSREK